MGAVKERFPVILILIAFPPVNRRRNALLFRATDSDDTGHYSFTGIMPGTYSVLAFQNIRSGEPWLNSDFLEKYIGRARSIKLSTGPQASVQLEPQTN